MDEIDKSLIQHAIATALVSGAEEAADSIKRSDRGRRIIALWVLRCVEDMGATLSNPYAQIVSSETKRMLADSSPLIARSRISDALIHLKVNPHSTPGYSGRDALVYAFNCVEASVNTRVSDTEKAAYVCYAAGSALESVRHELLKAKEIPLEETEEKQRGYLLDILNQHLDS